jgi:phosphate transport system protein
MLKKGDARDDGPCADEQGQEYTPSDHPDESSSRMTEFDRKYAQLHDDLLTQGDRVVEMTLQACIAFFERDQSKARVVIEQDTVIDQVDIDIERASIKLLTLQPADEYRIRSVLTIVKINNELERIADGAVAIAEHLSPDSIDSTIVDTYRVMANSVIGMVRDANQAMRMKETDLAQRVLAFDDTVDRFKVQLMQDAQGKLASGEYSVPFAMSLLDFTRVLERMADHCTNICEQLIYLETGKVVRHLSSGWSEPSLPDS